MIELSKEIDIDDLIHNMTPEELWAMSKDKEPINTKWTDEEIEQSKKIYEIMDLTDLDFEDVEKVLYEPRNAPLFAIEIY